MISVLIPVFNTDVSSLVTGLNEQLRASQIVYEIILLDDKSDETYRLLNRGLASDSIIYLESDVNHGRTAVRLLLAQKAVFDWLLFLDSDSLIHEHFIKNYINQIHNDLNKADVIVGGTAYQKEPPQDCDYHLHWAYGTSRERLDLSERAQFPYHGFTCNNMLIRKSVFQQLRFSPSLPGYGHEDTWIGIQLEKLQSHVHYIDNPVLHNGIEKTAVFLNKTTNALKNLVLLRDIVGEHTLRKHVKLFNVFYWQKKLHLTSLVRFIYFLLASSIKKKLHSCNPPLRLFDLYRLYLLIQLNKEKL